MTKRNLHYNNRKNLIKDNCMVCGTIENLQNHRIEPGGLYVKENVACLCQKHHLRIHNLIKFKKNYNFEEVLCQIMDEYQKEEFK